jgi:tripeptidyl-peptidase-1
MPHGWTKHSRIHPRHMLHMSIALRQSHIDDLDDYLMKVSSPASKDYGKHWSHTEIADTFAPSQNTIMAVQSWLIAAGIDQERISKSRSLGWLHFNATVGEAEALLRTEYHVYKHDSTGQSHVACEAYHVPR